jgi:hypothetical protein
MTAVVMGLPLRASILPRECVVVAVGPQGWHGGIKNSLYFAGFTRRSGLIASMECGVVLSVVPRM